MNLALLRSSRHVGMRGCLIQRLIGIAILAASADGINEWAGDPKTSVAKIRAAMAEIEEARRLTPPQSQAIKIEHMTLIKALDDAEAVSLKMNPEGLEDKTWWYTYLPGFHRARFLAPRAGAFASRGTLGDGEPVEILRPSRSTGGLRSSAKTFNITMKTLRPCRRSGESIRGRLKGSRSPRFTCANVSHGGLRSSSL